MKLKAKTNLIVKNILFAMILCIIAIALSRKGWAADTLSISGDILFPTSFVVSQASVQPGAKSGTVTGVSGLSFLLPTETKSQDEASEVQPGAKSDTVTVMSGLSFLPPTKAKSQDELPEVQPGAKPGTATELPGLSFHSPIKTNSQNEQSEAYQEVSPKQTRPDTWDKASVYYGGDEVVYNGKIYRAKWWTLGELPDSADVWEDTMVAAPETEVQPPVDSQPSVPQDTSLEPYMKNEKTYDATQPSASQHPSYTPLQPSGLDAQDTDVRVIAYYPSWRSDQSKLRYDIITHVVYAFAIPTEDGGLRPLDSADQVPSLISSAHSGGAKVLLGVGGWSYNDTPLEGTFLAATETQERTDAFVDAIVTMCDSYGFDGIDIDWEHPRVDGSSARQYENLMLALVEKLHSRDKLLTSAVISGATADGNIYYDAAAHSDKVLSTVDWIHVMAYDGGDGERHSSYEFALNAAEYWRDTRGVPAKKIVLGVPFYSRPGWASYGDILASAPAAKNTDHIDYNGMDVWYNGPETIRKKAVYAAKQLGGIMIWEISQDTADQQNSLLTAIGKGIFGITQE